MGPRWSFAITAAALCFFGSVAAANTDEVNVYGRDFAIREGGHFSVHCNVSHFEALKWQKDGVDITESSINNITLHNSTLPWGTHTELRVSYATVSHTGIYRCNSFHGRGQLVYVIGAGVIKTNKQVGDSVFLESRKLVKLECNVSDDKAQVTWARVKMDGDEEQITENFDKDKFKVSPNSLSILKFTNEDAEYKYLCKLSKTNEGGQTISADESFEIIVPPVAWMQKNQDLVENEKMVLNCSVTGHPIPEIVWKFENMTIDSSTDRITLENHGKVKNAILIIENITLQDKGNYTCHASILSGAKEASAYTIVRIKDKFAALWPFLGICAEVIVLCIIILIYEKRRNKSELDESDTDQSPEQKNTPDVGKDVRHRK